ncbi:hypothetical protein N7533_009933 [Penicillium manginii]|uniref:uncharacterized protein n=1 Tax=Penicillium manginii TaxID=203109 RepID=UPI0025495CE6|nr:uncharacterized protein N7533_010641 [Penicillium manginii]XP_056955800.1 uncharacterized protein N7533_009933 [Penicillium manginii]KAJ5741232.1 hypothetical protein N7533_010641 [Penicillium manginii]KAJ5742831.1 hypothetical protein N7533_009933 [Penicillium manginii]
MTARQNSSTSIKHGEIATINGDACVHVGGDGHLENVNQLLWLLQSSGGHDANRGVLNGRHSGGGKRALYGVQSDGHAHYGDYCDDGQCYDEHRGS